MAKYSRFDPRNKKRGKNKSRSIDRDTRIREVEDYSRLDKHLLREISHETDDEDLKEQGLYQ